jgi:glycosyltransferase involved in cell wall biosynthesis
LAYIAFLTSYFPSISETFIYNEIIRLRQRGVRIKTFSVRKPTFESISRESHGLYNTTTYLLPLGIVDLLTAHVCEFCRTPWKYTYSLAFLLTRYFKRPLNDRIKTLFHFAEGVYFAWSLRKESGAIHIHAHYASHPCTISFVASQLTGIPFSFTAHADDIVIEGLMLEEKVRAAKFVITCSNYGKRMLLKPLGDGEAKKVFTVYHGVDSDRFTGIRPDRGNGQFTFLHVGRLSPEKAQKQIVEACFHLRRKGLHFECIIVGDGPLREDLTRMAKALKVEECICFVGRVFQEEIVGYYLSADAFILSSIRENLPNVLLESLAAGVPVIAPRIGAIAELVEDGINGILVEPGNTLALSAAMERMMLDTTSRTRMGHSGRKLVREHFDREECIEKLLTVYATHGLVEPRHRI